LLRPEGFLVALVVLIARFAATRRVPVREAIGLALAAMPYAVFATTYYGSVLPQTVVAKDLVERSAAAQWFFIIQKMFLGNPASWTLGTSALVGVLIVRRHQRLLPFVFWGLAYVAFFSSVGSWWPWYVPPALLPFFALAGVGLAAPIGLLSPPRLGHGALALALGAVSLFLAADTMDKAQRNLEATSSLTLQLQEVAQWVNETTASTATVMLEPLGVFGYHAHRRVDDYPGLASRRVTNALKTLNRRVGGNPQDHEALRAAVEMVRPDVLVLRAPEYEAAARAGDLRAYELRRVFPIPWVSGQHRGALTPMFVLIRNVAETVVETGGDRLRKPEAKVSSIRIPSAS
jgi:hypothetical protein